MKLRILGTSSAFPTRTRNHTANLLNYSGESLLFDCGEGTQRQLRVSNENPQKITKIFISHWHGDHVLGLPGLLQSMGMNRRTSRLEIYGPIGTKKKLDAIMKAYESDRLSYRLDIKEINPKKVTTIFENDKYRINSVLLTHTVPCLGYSFEEKEKIRINTSILEDMGVKTKHPSLRDLTLKKNVTINGKKINWKKVTYTQPGKKFSVAIDTSYCDQIVDLAKNADVFLCEATFSNKIKDSAEKGGHMTTKEAAKLGKRAKVNHLVLTHFSQRYRSTKELESEAKSVFRGKLSMARDFMEIKF